MLEDREVKNTASTDKRRGRGQPYGQPAPAGWFGRRGYAPEPPEPDYMLWTHIGSESVFFYQPGSVEEHLVIEHGIPSVNMHWQIRGSCDHERDHLRQREIRLGAIGDLLAVPHRHEKAA